MVRVVGLMDEDDDAKTTPRQKAMERSLGTGVVIIDNGTILTNLHVVCGRQEDPRDASPTATNPTRT